MNQGAAATLAIIGSFLGFIAWIVLRSEFGLFPSDQVAAIVLLLFLATGFLTGLALGWLWQARRRNTRW